MSLILLLFAGVILISAIPFPEFIRALLESIQKVQDRLDTPSSRLFMSFAPFWFFITRCVGVVKGYAALAVMDFYVGVPSLLVLASVFTLSFHNWSFFQMFRNRMQVFAVSWGMYIFMDPLLGIVFPIVSVLMSLLFNSIVIGQFVSVLLMFVFTWLFTLTDVFVVLNFVIFCVTFLAYSERIIRHFEGDRQSILKSFYSRG
jgi:glycerol-3-phosphate acyltransferase PlsY